MTTLQKCVIAAATSVVMSATGVQGYLRTGEAFCTSGFVVDANNIAESKWAQLYYRYETGNLYLPREQNWRITLCYNKTDANALRYPEQFPVQKLVNAALSDADNEFFLLKEPEGYGQFFTEDWKLTNIDIVLQLAIQNGVCDVCADSGTVESGLEVAMYGIVTSMYPPTLDLIQVMMKNPDVNPCR